MNDEGSVTDKILKRMLVYTSHVQTIPNMKRLQRQTRGYVGGSAVVRGGISKASRADGTPYILLQPVPGRDSELLREDPNCVGAVLSDYGPFAHFTNVLRAISAQRDFAFVVGARHVDLPTLLGEPAEIDPRRGALTISGKEFIFSGAESDSAIAIRGHPDAAWFSYRPLYRYQPALAEHVLQGYERTGDHVHRRVAAKRDSTGRIWVQGIGWPATIAKWAIDQSDYFYKLLSTYPQVLRELLYHATTHPRFSTALGNLLVAHYSFSPLVALPTDSLWQIVAQRHGRAFAEHVARATAEVSPFVASTPLDSFLATAPNRLEACTTANIALDSDRHISDAIPVRLLTTVLFLADVRRSVINAAVTANEWLRHSSSHRKEYR